MVISNGSVPDWLTAIFTGAAVFVAWKALGTWKTELTRRIHHDAAWRTLTRLYECREALLGVRKPLAIFGAQASDRPNPQQPDPVQQALTSAYVERWREVESSFARLRTDMLSTEPLLGAALQEPFEALQRASGILFASLTITLRSADTPGFFDQIGQYHWDQAFADVHGIGIRGKEDRVEPAVLGAVKQFEEALKPL